MQNINEKSDEQKRAENTKAVADRKLQLTHGKKWKDFTKDALAAKERMKARGDIRVTKAQKPLRKGEVRTLDKRTGKWKSNKK